MKARWRAILGIAGVAVLAYRTVRVAPASTPATEPATAPPPRDVRRWRWGFLAAVAVTLVVFGSMAYGYGKPLGAAGDPSFLVQFGKTYEIPGLLPDGAFVREGTGFDGQWYFYLAQDPLLLDKKVERGFDHPRYRAQRILLPMLAWVFSGGGNPDALLWVLPLLNLLAIVLSGALLARFLAARGAPSWLSLLYMLSVGMVLGALHDVGDPFAASLFVAGIVLWADDRPRLAIIPLTMAPLARELLIVPVAVIALIELLRWRQRALLWLLPIVVTGAWTVYVKATVPSSPGRAVAKPELVPLRGAVNRIEGLLRSDIPSSVNWQVVAIVTILATVALFAVRGYAGVRERVREGGWPSREVLLPVVGLGTVITIPFLTSELWTNPQSYTRYGAAAAGPLLMLYGVRRDKLALGLAVALFALTLVNPVVSLLPARNGTLLHL